MNPNATLNIGVVAGEPSGDALGAGLIIELKRLFPMAQFTGVGGPKMHSAGCEILYDMERIELMGLDGLFDKLGDILKIRSSLYDRFVANPAGCLCGNRRPGFQSQSGVQA